jgi:hypothetical protein
MGVELEVQARSSLGRSIAINDFYTKSNGQVGICKRDGSLHEERGFEICSRPGTLRWHQKAWEGWMKDAATSVLGWKGDNCGMHVHISRKAFSSPIHIAKFIGFIHSDLNKPFIEKIAGRDSNTYTQIYNKKVKDEAKLLRRGATSSRGKYDAVNQVHPHTLEVRIFRSNVNLRGFLKNIEFVHALWSYTASAPASKCTKDGFLNWLPAYTSIYPNLARWLEQGKMITFNYNRTEGEVTCA